jgi:hypothetical protein
LYATGRPLVVVALTSPTDILSFPEIPAYLAMLGTTPGQQEAILQALTGQGGLEGQIPLTGLIP